MNPESPCLLQLRQERDREIEKIERNLALEIRRTQDWYKLWAVLIPPIPPLLLAFFVFFHRRQNQPDTASRHQQEQQQELRNQPQACSQPMLPSARVIPRPAFSVS